jgi:hypothetical protein
MNHFSAFSAIRLVVLFLASCHCQCPNGYQASLVVPNKCYYFAVNLTNWFTAESYCRQQQPNGHLVSIGSAFENQNLEGERIKAVVFVASVLLFLAMTIIFVNKHSNLFLRKI